MARSCGWSDCLPKVSVWSIWSKCYKILQQASLDGGCFSMSYSGDRRVQSAQLKSTKCQLVYPSYGVWSCYTYFYFGFTLANYKYRQCGECDYTTTSCGITSDRSGGSVCFQLGCCDYCHQSDIQNFIAKCTSVQ